MADGAVTSPSIERAEHIDENVSAKRTGNYLYDATNLVWVRAAGSTAGGTKIGDLLAGENLTYNRMMTMPTYTYSAVAVADVQVKASPGILHSVTITCNDAAPTAGSLIIYDNTAESGTQVFNHTFTTTPFTPLTVMLDYNMVNGIYLGFTTTADVNVSVSYL